MLSSSHFFYIIRASTLLCSLWLCADVKVEEDMNKVIQIQQLLVGDFPPLYGKRFIYEGDLNKITSKLIVKCHIFLFDDVIVYSHTKIGSFWRYKGTIELGTAWVRVLKGGRTYKNVFQIVGPKKTWTFYANSPEELNVWLDNLNGAISALVEKDPSLVDKRANVSVKMGHGLWRMLSISRRKDYDKQFSETLKSDETKDITAQTPPPPPAAAEPEKKDDKDKDKGVDENRTDDTASPSVNVPKTVEKEGPLADEKKPTEVLPERPKVEEIPSEPPKSITPKLTKSESSRPQSTTAAVAANSPRGSSEERSGKESAAKLSRSGERPVALPPQATATTTHSSSYSAIIRNSAPTPVVMQEEFDEDYEGNSLLGGPKKPKSQSSSWCCC